MRIRAARSAELPILQDIEIEAGSVFHEVGMDEIAGDVPFPIPELLAYVEAGHAWVACDDSGALFAAADADRPVGYLLAEVVDDALHVEQVSVLPTYAHQGIGRALIDHAATVAAKEGYPALTLTTFVDVPWNGPYYARLGFTPIATPGPELQAIRDKEAALGLDRWPRVAMRRST
jgi:ribosomal protein S18 acetylase RimI-like enzyme